MGASHPALLVLIDQRRRFDFVYVDGSHLALDVLVDAALAWRLLSPGGVLVFDEVAEEANQGGEHTSPLVAEDLLEQRLSAPRSGAPRPRLPSAPPGSAPRAT